MLLFDIITWYITRVKKKNMWTPPSRASKGEIEVEKVLKKLGVQYKMQYPFGWMHADFAVYKDWKLYLIEYNGRQHYYPVKHFGGISAFIRQIFRDIMEILECKSQKIPLLRIKYNVPFKDLEQVITSFLEK